jgi:hypothetical protein
MKYIFIASAVIILCIAPPHVRAKEIRSIHIIVALCDNVYQGIVPVPASLGNGQDPAGNLYWGASCGVKTFFRKSLSWKMLSVVKNPEEGILERIVFVSTDGETYIVADAYDGALIRNATEDFLSAAVGRDARFVQSGNTKIAIRGGADLLCYVGHDGLMDFSIKKYPEQARQGKELIILACFSKKYFSPAVRAGGGHPLLWTTHLFCPEAYTLEAAIAGWIKRESDEKIRMRAVQAYSKYQRCSVNAAKKLIVTGWE